MITKQSTLEEYMKAVKLKYEEEKTSDYSSFLINPSRAKLRTLCIERMKTNLSPDDLLSFTLFFGFDFDLENLNKLKSQTDKFRPIETFLKGETELSDIEGINIAAFLVDYNPRPFNRFLKNGVSHEIKKRSVSSVDKQNRMVSNNFDLVESTANKVNNMLVKKKIVFFVVLLSLFFMGYTIKDMIFSDKECMKWETDHYEAVDCKNKQVGIGQFVAIIPIDESTIKLKKLDSNKKLHFFKNEIPIVWYCKKDGTVELFNSHGFHPETGKPLKPITQYIIDKYQLRTK